MSDITLLGSGDDNGNLTSDGFVAYTNAIVRPILVLPLWECELQNTNINAWGNACSDKSLLHDRAGWL